MGWYINYEIAFEDLVYWEDEQVRKALPNIDCNFLYLRNYEEPRAIFCLYMKHEIKDLANMLARFFDIRVKYRLYGSDKWSIPACNEVLAI
jgi:hypothetical protein